MSVISQWLEDPLGYLLSLLPLIPALLPALILHEVAHGYTAYRLGDPTAKMLGRLSLNPLRHLDLRGTICMFLVGLGWAKPVPVDPRYFRRPRRDSFLVSIAGITANLVMFLIGCLLMYGMVYAAMRAVPADMWLDSGLITEKKALTVYYISHEDIIRYAYGMGDALIEPYLGRAWGFVFEVVVKFTTVNLSLALFNLIPMPPLDGYQIINSLVLNRSLYISRKIARFCQMALIILAFTGLLGKGLSWLMQHVLEGVGGIALLISGI